MKHLSAALALLLALLPAHAMAACGKTGSASSPAAVVQAQVDAYNAHDVDAFVACYADDASLSYVSGEKPPIQAQPPSAGPSGFLPGSPRASVWKSSGASSTTRW